MLCVQSRLSCLRLPICENPCIRLEKIAHERTPRNCINPRGHQNITKNLSRCYLKPTLTLVMFVIGTAADAVLMACVEIICYRAQDDRIRVITRCTLI